jgi:hypothetical protein
MRANVKITLDEPHLSALLRGGEVKVTVQGVIVRMILKDIGFEVIGKCLHDAIDRKDHYVGYEDKQ